MLKRLLWGGALIGSLVGCGDGTEPTGDNAVAVTSNQFTPASLTVAPATTVTWSFQSGIHDVTFEDGTGNSARNQSGGTHSRSFGTAGTFRYRCTLHSENFATGMVGTVQVQ
jgi:plastocyanin